MHKNNKVVLQKAKIICIVLLCMEITVVPSLGQATISCATAASRIRECVSYLKLRGSGPERPSTTCCNNVRALNRMATTRALRVSLCTCFKNQAGSARSLNNVRVQRLPAACGVSLSFSIGLTMDCNNVR